MRQIRTDLAMESVGRDMNGEMSGVKVNNWETMGVSVTEVIITDEQTAKQFGKPCGRYITLECRAILEHDPDSRTAMANILGEELSRLIPQEEDKTVLVAGLGNRYITPDSLGTLAAERTLVTRHMFKEIPEYTDEKLRSVCAISPGVLGVTGVETMEMLKSLAATLQPSAVVCIDSLAAHSSLRIGCSVQITDTGIEPGSGVGNHRRALNAETLGAKVIAIGVPTVIYASALVGEDAAGSELKDAEKRLGDLIVTPREIDAIVKDAAEIIANGINKALQPELDDEEIASMLD